MRFQATHRSTYRYSRPVFLEPHLVRLRPRQYARQRLLAFDMTISPQPDGLSEHLDAENNPVAEAWFSDLTEIFEVTTAFEVETLTENPLDFIVTAPGVETLPAEYPADMAQALAVYRTGGTLDPGAQRLGDDLAAKAGGQVFKFLFDVCDWLYRNLEVIIRPEGVPMTAADTLQCGTGSCRDLTVLFMDICRSQGLAARFVSGYQAGDPGQQDRELHAWPEVYLPGGGWRGFDPTLGLAVTDQHVAVAASWHPAGAAPVVGTIRGTAAQAELSFDILLDALPGDGA